MIDLHLHSTCSDGSLTPAILADEVAVHSLTAAALTDHDTMAGVEAFQAAAADRFAAIGGVEMSLDHSPGTLHLLGYYVDPQDPGLSAALRQLRAGRDDRNGLILDRLRDLGMPLSQDAVRQYAGDEVIGRPHIAQAMVAAGYVGDTREAFDRYLAKGGAAYCDRTRLAIDTAIGLIRDAGGIPVLAHPATLQMSASSLRDFVAHLVDQGLQGIEVYYPEHRPNQTDAYRALTQRFDLVATGGTDFHGVMNPKLHVGTGFGGFSVPDVVYTELEKRRA